MFSAADRFQSEDSGDSRGCIKCASSFNGRNLRIGGIGFDDPYFYLCMIIFFLAKFYEIAVWDFFFEASYN